MNVTTSRTLKEIRKISSGFYASLERAKKKISGKDAYEWLVSNGVPEDTFEKPVSFYLTLQKFKGRIPSINDFIDKAKEYGVKATGGEQIDAAKDFYEKVVFPAAQEYARSKKS